MADVAPPHGYCRDCRFWDARLEAITWGLRRKVPGVADLEDEWDDAKVWALFPHPIGVCECPGIPFFEFPGEDSATTVDGSQYRGDLITGPKFGCVLWQPQE